MVGPHISITNFCTASHPRAKSEFSCDFTPDPRLPAFMWSVGVLAVKRRAAKKSVGAAVSRQTGPDLDWAPQHRDAFVGALNARPPCAPSTFKGRGTPTTRAATPHSCTLTPKAPRLPIHCLPPVPVLLVHLFSAHYFKFQFWVIVHAPANTLPPPPKISNTRLRTLVLPAIKHF